MHIFTKGISCKIVGKQTISHTFVKLQESKRGSNNCYGQKPELYVLWRTLSQIEPIVQLGIPDLQVGSMCKAQGF